MRAAVGSAVLLPDSDDVIQIGWVDVDPGFLLRVHIEGLILVAVIEWDAWKKKGM
jgi:hypothetical protein